MDNKPQYLHPDQLCVGMYIHLDLSWMDHPFTFSNFKIKTEEQLAQVRALGLKQIRYDPLRSDQPPAPPPAAGASASAAVAGVTAAGTAVAGADTEGTGVAGAAAPAEADATISATAVEAAASATPASPETPPTPGETAAAAASAGTQAAEVFHQQRLSALHDAIHQCEQKFAQATNEARRIEREIMKNPPRTLEAAQLLVDDMVDSVLSESDIALHAMQPKAGANDNYAHSLNVAVLSLILAKSTDMTAEDARTLGLGGLLHDIGKSEIPDRVTLNPDPLTRAETALLQQHSEFGARFAREKQLPEPVCRILLQHHECSDGSGYPGHLKQDQIDPLARIVSVVNTYDNLCNPVNPVEAMTPYEALAHMFARMRQKFDADLLKLLIKTLGVYPPGSIVELSDGRFGLVASVNPSKPMRPYVVIYAPEVPREQPLIINLGDAAGLSISRCIRPGHMPKEVLAYLSPGKRLCYFFHPEQEAPAKPA